MEGMIMMEAAQPQSASALRRASSTEQVSACIKHALQPVVSHHHHHNNNVVTSNNSANSRSLLLSSLESVREGVLKSASGSDPSDFYPEDIERIKTSDWAVKRFMYRVRAQDDVQNIIDKSVEAIVKNLRWRKSVQIRERTEETFPTDFFHTGIIGYGKIPSSPSPGSNSSKFAGRKVLYINTKVYRRQPVLTPHFFAFGNTLFDRIDQELNGERMILFIDLSDISLANADVSFLRYYINLIAFEFPLMIDHCFLYCPPWYMKTVISLFLRFLPAKFTRCVSMITSREDGIKLLGGEEGLPIAAGGNLDTVIHPPAGSPTAHEYGDIHDIPREVIDKARKDYNLI